MMTKKKREAHYKTLRRLDALVACSQAIGKSELSADESISVLRVLIDLIEDVNSHE